MKPLVSNRGLENSIGARFDRTLLWHRRFWNSYYLFELKYDSMVLTVYKNMYNPETWQDEWTEVHCLYVGSE